MKINVRFIAELAAEWTEGSYSDRIICNGMKIEVDKDMNEAETSAWEESLLVNTMMVAAGCAIGVMRTQMNEQEMSEDEQQAMLDTLLNLINPLPDAESGNEDILRNISGCFDPKYQN